MGGKCLLSTSPSTGYIIFYSNIQRKATAIGNYFTILAGGLNDTKCLVNWQNYFYSHAIYSQNIFLLPKYYRKCIFANFPFLTRQHFMNFLLTNTKKKALVFQDEKAGAFIIFSL